MHENIEVTIHANKQSAKTKTIGLNKMRMVVLGSGKMPIRILIKHASSVTSYSATDYPKSVSNSSVLEVLTSLMLICRRSLDSLSCN